MRTRTILGIAVALVLATAGSASAEKKRVGVPKFDGPQEALIRKKVMQVLKAEGYDLVKSREIDAAVQSASINLDSNDGFRALAKELALSAVVTGEVSKKKAKLSVRNGADGSVSGEGSFAGANPRKISAEIGKSFMRRLGAAIDRGKPPSGAKKPQKAAVAEAPEDNENAPEAGGDEDDKGDKGENKGDKNAKGAAGAAAAKESGGEEAAGDGKKKKAKAEPEEAEDEGPSGPRPVWLDAALGGGGFSRNLSYNQDINKALRQYQLGLGPEVVAHIVFYPLALSQAGPLAHIGVQLDIEQGFGITSSVGASTAFPNGATFPTVIHDWAGGLRYRIPVAAHQVAILAGGGEHAFSFRSSGASDRAMLDIPDTIYRYIRGGLEARFALPSGFSVFAGAGYRYILNKGGQIHDTIYFPHLTVVGMDAHAGLGYRVTPTIEARAAADLRRYVYDMHSVPADVGTSQVAGGAVDQYISFMAMVAITLGGDHGGGDQGDAEEAPAAKSRSKSKAKGSSGDEGGGDSGAE